MIEVFPLEGIFRTFDARVNQAALSVLVLLFLVSLGLYALNRFENFALDQKVHSFIVFALLIGFWPIIVTGIKSLVDVLNTFLITSVFHNEFGAWKGREMLGTLIWKRVHVFSTGVFDGLFILKTLGVLLAFLLDVGQYFLYLFFLIFFFFYKIFGPFVLARGILSENLTVFSQLLREVTLLFLWQTTFVILIGVFLMTFGGKA